MVWLLFTLFVPTLSEVPRTVEFRPSQRVQDLKRNQSNTLSEGSYFPPPTSSAGGGYLYPSPDRPYPVYGPPEMTEPPPLPVEPHIDLELEDLILRCITDEPYEHIVWTRYACPYEYVYGRGDVVAEGAIVYEPNHYDVQFLGQNGVIVSSFLIKNPLHTGGVFSCQAWPHYPTSGESYQYKPSRYKPVSDVFLIGGRDVIDECFRGPFPVYSPPRPTAQASKPNKPKPTQKPKLSVPDLARRSRNASEHGDLRKLEVLSNPLILKSKNSNTTVTRAIFSGQHSL